MRNSSPAYSIGKIVQWSINLVGGYAVKKVSVVVGAIVRAALKK